MCDTFNTSSLVSYIQFLIYIYTTLFNSHFISINQLIHFLSTLTVYFCLRLRPLSLPTPHYPDTDRLSTR